jgi:hypothetical protein
MNREVSRIFFGIRVCEEQGGEIPLAYSPVGRADKSEEKKKKIRYKI